jgi:exodeoxyribonuclease VII large subunit
MRAAALGVEAIVLARGGGSREDLAVFDTEALARCLARCPLPVVTGLGHEDDTTIADLVADHRAATPTAAMVALLPDRRTAQVSLLQLRRHLSQVVQLRLSSERQQLQHRVQALGALHPRDLLAVRRRELAQAMALLKALSPQHLLERGFSLVHDERGRLVRSVAELVCGQRLRLDLADGHATTEVREIQPSSPAQA